MAKDSGAELGFGRFNSMGRAHHESDAEFYGRRERDMDQLASDRADRRGKAPLGRLPGGGSAVLRVSIPVKVGGYTGQRDQWVENEQDYGVSVDGDKVVLHNTGSGGSKITFDINGLRAALAVLEDYR